MKTACAKIAQAVFALIRRMGDAFCKQEELLASFKMHGGKFWSADVWNKNSKTIHL
jgi:hypothetical protein